MTEKALKDGLRASYTSELANFLEEKYNVDICQTAAGTLMIPVLDEEGNERWLKFSVIVPNADEEEGTDGYALADEYKAKLAAAAERKEKAAAKAAAAAAAQAKSKSKSKKKAE